MFSGGERNRASFFRDQIPKDRLRQTHLCRTKKKEGSQSISRHFPLITASENWMLKLPSGITPLLNCISVPRAWQDLIPFMSSPWITSWDWIISEHPTPTDANVYKRQRSSLIYVHTAAVRSTQDPDPSAAICASLWDLTGSHLCHPFKSCGNQSFHKDLVKAPSCPSHNTLGMSWKVATLFHQQLSASQTLGYTQYWSALHHLFVKLFWMLGSVRNSSHPAILKSPLALSCLFSGYLYLTATTLLVNFGGLALTAKLLWKV